MHSLYAPSFVRARTPRQLQRRMMQVQTRDGARHNWYDIQFANGLWYAWYIKREDENVEEAIIEG